MTDEDDRKTTVITTMPYYHYVTSNIFRPYKHTIITSSSEYMLLNFMFILNLMSAFQKDFIVLSYFSKESYDEYGEVKVQTSSFSSVVSGQIGRFPLPLMIIPSVTVAMVSATVAMVSATDAIVTVYPEQY